MTLGRIFKFAWQAAVLSVFPVVYSSFYASWPDLPVITFLVVYGGITNLLVLDMFYSEDLFKYTNRIAMAVGITTGLATVVANLQNNLLIYADVNTLNVVRVAYLFTVWFGSAAVVAILTRIYRRTGVEVADKVFDPLERLFDIVFGCLMRVLPKILVMAAPAISVVCFTQIVKLNVVLEIGFFSAMAAAAGSCIWLISQRQRLSKEGFLVTGLLHAVVANILAAIFIVSAVQQQNRFSLFLAVLVYAITLTSSQSISYFLWKWGEDRKAAARAKAESDFQAAVRLGLR